jgi:lysine 2,3-aminomutase
MIKVRPYYLFHCDEVQGTEHLRTPVETGIKIIEGMRGHISGMAIPTFVVDLPFGHGKVPLQPNYILEANEEELLIRNYQGRIFRYRNPVLQKHQQKNSEVVSTGHKAVDDILAGPKLSFESKGATDADRLVVRS